MHWRGGDRRTTRDERDASGHPAHIARIELLHRTRAALLHGGPGFDAYKLKYPLHAFLAEGAQSPEIGPADPDRLRAHRQRLHRVGASAETRVDDDRHASVHRREDLRQRVDGRAAIVFAAATVVGNQNAVDAVLYRQLGIV